MRDLINIAERLTFDRQQLDAPDILGLIDIEWLAEMLHVEAEDHIIFRNAMRKILVNRSEDMNDFEIFNVADAFVNFIGLSPEDKMIIARRLAVLHTDPNDHHLDNRPPNDPEHNIVPPAETMPEIPEIEAAAEAEAEAEIKGLDNPFNDDVPPKL